MGLGRGCVLPSYGSGGLPPEKKNNFALKLCNSEQVLVLLSYITGESGGIIPSPESGGPIPCPPAPTPMVPCSGGGNWKRSVAKRRSSGHWDDE